jgi:glutamyl-tRNA synthetase
MVTWRLEQLQDFSSSSLEEVFRRISEHFQVRLSDFTRPFYVAVTGAESAPPLFQSMQLLGPDLVRIRLRRALEALGGIPNKKLKGIEETYRSLFGARD